MTLKEQIVAMKTETLYSVVLNQMNLSNTKRYIGVVAEKIPGFVEAFLPVEMMMVLKGLADKRFSTFYDGVEAMLLALLVRFELSLTEKTQILELLKAKGVEIFNAPEPEKDGKEGFDELARVITRNDGSPAMQSLAYLANESKCVADGKPNPDFIRKDASKDEAERVCFTTTGHLAAFYFLLRASD